MSKKILYIHQYFKTPNEPGGTRSYWIAKELVKNGYEVCMLTSNAGTNNKTKYTNIDGIDVTYLNVPYSNSMGILRRGFSFFRFMILSTIIATCDKKMLIL